MPNTTRTDGRKNVTAKVKIDARKYGRLHARALPARITSEGENERMLAEIERLIDKGADRRSPEEGALLDLMVLLVEEFDSEANPIKKAEPHQVLQHLMDARQLKQSDLLPVLGSRGYTSDIVNGKRGISKEHAKKLGEFFHVSPEIFI